MKNYLINKGEKLFKRIGLVSIILAFLMIATKIHIVGLILMLIFGLSEIGIFIVLKLKKDTFTNFNLWFGLVFIGFAILLIVDKYMHIFNLFPNL